MVSENVIDGELETTLWDRYRREGSPVIREKLIRQYTPLVKYVAGKISVGLPASVEFDDLVGFGTFGLLDAIEKFDPGKHVKFKTYAVMRIRGSIFDELRAIDWVPRSVRQKSREIEDTVQNLEANLGRPASNNEIAQSMNISLSDLNQTMIKLNGVSVLSLYEIWNNGDDENLPIMDSIESPSHYQPEEIAEKTEIRRVIVEAINDLPDKEKKVLILYYYESLTLKEIGKVLEVTESRVSQLHTKAITRLRSCLTSHRKGIV